MRVTDLALNRALGMRPVSASPGQILELPESPLVLNHVGTVHASAQFALAEACSGEFLLRAVGEAQNQLLAVLRTSEVKFRKPAHGTLRGAARFSEDASDFLVGELAARGRALVSVLVEISDAHETITMTGEYTWFVQRRDDPNK
jgi:acyl-coenzyme A thioesterase PaaI-like protein